jgi:hypothetical protein
MTTPSQIRAIRVELATWLEGKPDHVRLVGRTVLHELDSTLIAAQPNPEIVRRLAENITVLERLAKQSGLSLGFKLTLR